MYNLTTAAPSVESQAAYQTLTDSGAPVIIIGFDGSIIDASHTAQALMGYASELSLDTNFFTLIHKNQLYTVMRDVADIICRGKQQASWLIRLKSSGGSWKWFNAEVRKSHRCEDCIYVMLHSV